jgi:hypothetical protein
MGLIHPLCWTCDETDRWEMSWELELERLAVIYLSRVRW